VTAPTLPAGGRHIVDTLTDAYDVDVDARVAIRLDLAGEAAGRVASPDVFLFDTVELADGVLVFDADTFPRVTDAVLGVTPVAVEVAA
jgi:hypothetical protein